MCYLYFQASQKTSIEEGKQTFLMDFEKRQALKRKQPLFPPHSTPKREKKTYCGWDIKWELRWTNSKIKIWWTWEQIQISRPEVSRGYCWREGTEEIECWTSNMFSSQNPTNLFTNLLTGPNLFSAVFLEIYHFCIWGYIVSFRLQHRCSYYSSSKDNW